MITLALACVVGTPRALASGPAVGLHAGADNTLTQYADFGDWLGRKVTHRVVFADISSWSGIASPWFLSATRQWVASDPARTEIISLALLPTGAEGDFAAIIRGEHDSKFTSFAQKLMNAGVSDRVIVRLAWEGNGDWYPWAYAGDPAGFRSAFRRAVQVMRQTAPALRIEWNVSCRASRRGGPAHWTEGYPGDDVVDIVSMDVYDEWITTWTDLLNGEAGLREFREFAIQHDKPEAYPEWSCSTNVAANGGGDNPVFVENMAHWFAARPGKVVYQGYWNTSSGGPNAAIFMTSKPVLVPAAAAAYLQFFSPPRAPSGLAVR